jgi:crotonobetainyl-CoA:carnitine CoA-transferase CaiB-like acyl-CoA transferase
MTAVAESSAGAGPLAGIRVIDLTSVVLGPYATQMVGDLGADIIKVEAPEGDTTRYTGPGAHADMAALFMGVNRSKRSLVLDLKQKAARDALLRLVDGADVFVHSVRPQKLRKLGLDPDALLARNPRLVYAGVHGWREDGPYGGRPAYDDIIQGLSGFTALMEKLVGEPRYAPTIIADKTCGLVASQAILAALVHRERTGKGQFVEIPMFETMAAYVMVEHLYGRGFVPPRGEMGYPRVLVPWRRPYATQDGHICMLAYTDAQFTRFWQAVGKPEVMQDPRFVSLGARTRHIGEVYEAVGREMTAKTSAEWLELLDRLEIPAGPAPQLEEVLEDPHLAAIGFFREVEHPSEGRLVTPDIPVRFAGSPAEIQRLQPRLGEHGAEILREAGLDEAEIAALVASGATRVG